ncbi:MAG: hypothetical protein R3321_01290 [Nitrososphaeraceae archaeon]|nr:hypothetical protein [Nitrososphaeraceae archaeon]
MPVRVLDETYTTRDFTIIAVCMAFYLNSKGLNEENYNVVRILRTILTKLPELARKNLISMFKLDVHLDHNYTNRENNNNNIVDKYIS